VGQERSGLEESGNTAGDGAKNNPESRIRMSKVWNEKTNIDNAVFEEPEEAGFGFVLVLPEPDEGGTGSVAFEARRVPIRYPADIGLSVLMDCVMFS